MLDTSLIFDGTITAESAPANQGSTIVGVAVTSTRVSTNIIDLLTGRDVGAAEPLGVHVDITTAFTSTNSAALTIALQVCDTTNGTYLEIIDSPLIPVAQLIAGAPLFRYAIPVNEILNATAGVLKTPGRYLQLAYKVTTGIFSAGAVFSYITPRMDRNTYFSYPANYSVSVASGEI